MWNLLENVSLFNRLAGEDSEYDAHVHLSQMISVLGDPPETLIQREQMCRKAKLGRMIINQNGEKCETMNEFLGGGFFDKAGRTIRRDLVKERKTLSDAVTELAGQEKKQFLDFADSMLQ
ncbi:hypothetical protein QQS21_005685 [Conoideocrella luteorostrata]|uniref:Uncharacterized protein n=1 Tax=Conoideocrella luteorostrata TaxID=1105319 RepID=A0AAJ0FYS9_9HYPO|nr:hypothetical protein QQS21_005685 [Conoideocrella luteorostrata]